METSRIKHLELIQAVITRLSGHSFAIKSVGITVASALISFGASQKNPNILLVALIPVFTCWGLDGFYLRRERMYRALYEAERRQAGEGSFVMKADDYMTSVPSWSRTVLSRSLFWLYASLIFVILLARYSA